MSFEYHEEGPTPGQITMLMAMGVSQVAAEKLTKSQAKFELDARMARDRKRHKNKLAKAKKKSTMRP